MLERLLALGMVTALCMSRAPASAAEWETGNGFRRAVVNPKAGGAGFTTLGAADTGITFTNRLGDSALATNQVLEVGSGVALGDIDGDGLTDVYFCASQGGNKLFRNLGEWKFKEVTDQSGVTCAGQFSTGCAFADVDGDGDLDLLVTGIGAGARLFTNDGHGLFQETEAGLDNRGGSTSMALADLNGDGFLDLYVANYHTRTVKDSAGLEVSVRHVRGQLEITPPGMFLPLYGKNGSISLFERGEPDKVYLNDGRGRFKALSWTGGAFLDPSGKPLSEEPKDWGLAVMLRDLNGDRAPDIYVCNDFFNSPDGVWLNDGHGKFRPGPPRMLRHTTMSSMAVDVADINRDGLDDIFVLDMMSREHSRRHRQRGSLVHVKTVSNAGDPLARPEYPRNTLFLNRGDGTYTEIAALAGVEASEWSWSTTFIDVDLDGFEDLLVANGNLRDGNNADATGKGNLRFGKLETANLLFRNNGNLTFTEAGREYGFDHFGISHGMALGDLDNDGDLDVVINSMGTSALVLRNEASAPRVAVRLKGIPPNSRGVGARITLRGHPAGPQTQEVMAGGRYLSGDDGLRMFAAGGASNDLTLEVQWRNGTRTVLNHVQPNSIYEVAEEGAVPDEKPEPTPPALFQDVSSWLKPAHQDAAFDDWGLQPFLPTALSQGGPGVSWYDLDQDGRDDLLVGNGRGGNHVVFLNSNGNGKAGFHPVRRAEPLQRDQTTLLGWRSGPDIQLLAGLSNFEDGANAPAAINFDLGNPGRDQKLVDAQDSTGPLALGFVQGEFLLFAGGRCRPGKYPEPASSRLFRRGATGWELDPKRGAALADAGLVNGATWADLDNDGTCELILACDWGPVRVFRVQPDRLEEMTQSLGLEKYTGKWNGVATGDFDGDGRMEIVASNWGRNTKYERHRARPIRIYYGDWNNDGRTEMLEAYFEPALTNYAPFVTLDVMREFLPEIAARFPTFKSYGEASIDKILSDVWKETRFAEANTFETTVFSWAEGKISARPLPVEAQFAPAFGIVVADADGDGREDIFLSQNFFPVDAETTRLDGGLGLWLKGDGKGGFKPLSARQSGVSIPGEQRGCAASDFDQDGRVDLAVGVNRGAFALFRNTTAKAGVRVRLLGPPENPDAIGASVRLRLEKGWTPIKTIQAGGGYWSQNSLVQVFGLPSRALEAEVTWPGGKRTRMAVEGAPREITVKF